jgi:hypothetical protein
MLYLIMGWGMLGLGYAYAHNLSDTVMLLLLAGEAAYSCGAFVHTREQLPFHTSRGMRLFSLVSACIGRQSPTSLWIGAVHSRLGRQQRLELGKDLLDRVEIGAAANSPATFASSLHSACCAAGGGACRSLGVACASFFPHV